jgi:hypothetical protein
MFLSFDEPIFDGRLSSRMLWASRSRLIQDTPSYSSARQRRYQRACGKREADLLSGLSATVALGLFQGCRDPGIDPQSQAHRLRRDPL